MRRGPLPETGSEGSVGGGSQMGHCCQLLGALVPLCPRPGPLTLQCGVGKRVPGARLGARTRSALGPARQRVSV